MSYNIDMYAVNICLLGCAQRMVQPPHPYNCFFAREAAWPTMGQTVLAVGGQLGGCWMLSLHQFQQPFQNVNMGSDLQAP